jgi:solute carrier family 6 (neurotransmitter transporter, amino acid/orphan) member 15/16/17/18/20
LIFANGAGSYIFQLMDSFAGNYTLLIIAFCEVSFVPSLRLSHVTQMSSFLFYFEQCTAISYVYGLKRFADDIELMTGSRPHLYWMLCWKYISPLAMLSILFASFMNLVVNGSSYPAWVAEIGQTKNQDWPHWCIFAGESSILK